MAKQGPQAGILNRPPQHLLLATFEFIGTDPRATLDALRGLVERELTSELVVPDAPTPPDKKEGALAEPGELGFQSGYDRAFLTITLGLSSSGFEKLGVAETERPTDLRPISWGELGNPQPAAAQGILSCRSAPTTSTSVSTSSVGLKRSKGRNLTCSQP